MAKQLQPTSLIMFVAVVLVIVFKWAYDQGKTT